MIQLKHISHGKQLPSLPALFINDWYKEKFNVLVDLPVSTHKSLLIFNLQKELEKREQFKKLSQKSYLALIDVVASSLASLDRAAMMKAITQAGIDLPKETIESTLKEIEKEVNKQITGAGIASILVKDVLSAKMSRVTPMRDVSFSGIIDAVTRVQDLYGSFAASQNLATVGEQITSMFQEVSLIKHVHDVWVTFNKHKSATVKGRLTYALDSLYQYTFDQNMVELETKVQGMHYHVTDVKLVKDMKYRQVVSMYFIALRGLMGIEATEKKDLHVSLSSLLDHFMLNIPENLPTLPKELICSSSEIKDAQHVFAKLWLMNIYTMILTNDEGQLEHQINNVMEERKYTRNESWDGLVREGISISSLIYTAYLKTGAQFRDWAKDENIYFVNDDSLTYNTKIKFNKFVFEMVSGYNTFLKLDHTRFLHNPAHIINFSESGIKSYTDNQFFVKDEDISFKGTIEWIVNPETLVRTLYWKNNKLRGTDLDVVMDVHRPLLPLARPMHPLLGFTLSRPLLWGGDVSTAFLGIQNLEELVKQTNIPGEILRQSELQFIIDKTDLAERFDLSEEVAEMIWKGAGMYVSLARQGVLFFTWDYDTAPVVEFSAVDPSRDYEPFVGQYPYLLTYSNTLPSITTTPGAKGEKPNLPEPVVAKPKSEPEKKKEDEKPSFKKDDKEEGDKEPEIKE